MALCRFYADDGDRFGPLKNMDLKPFWHIKCVTTSRGDDEWHRVSEDEVSLAHILVRDKGVKLQPGLKYKFTIEVYPPTPVVDIEMSGPVFDVTGYRSVKTCVFVVNREFSYRYYGTEHCDRIMVRTNEITAGDDNVFVRPRFNVYLNKDDPFTLTLGERMRLSETDIDLVLPSGTLSPVHSQVLRANSGYFSALLSFGTSSGKSVLDGNMLKLTDEFSDEVWNLAIEYMYRQQIECNDIGQLQDLLVLGDKYLVKELVVSVARRLQDFVGDRLYERATPYVISLMSMAVYYQTKLDSRGAAEMQDLLKFCHDLIHCRCHELFSQENFVTAYAEFIFYEKELRGEPTSGALARAGTAMDKPPMVMLGKRKWNTD